MSELETTTTDRLPWDTVDQLIEDAVNEYRKMHSGIHISLLGTTRGGKTTLVTGGGDTTRGILSHFEDVLVLDTTGDPGSISDYGKPLQKLGSIRGHRRLTVSDMETKTKQKVHKAIQKAVGQKGVAIYADEVRQLTDKKYFGLGPALDYIWLFCAKQGTSLIGGTQAPIWVPGAFYDQAKLHFIFKIRDKKRMMRLAEIGGDTDTLKAVIPTLNRFEFAMVDLEGDIHISKFDLHPKRKPEPIQEERKLRVIR